MIIVNKTARAGQDLVDIWLYTVRTWTKGTGSLLSHKYKIGANTAQNKDTKINNRPLGRAPTIIS